MITTAPSPGHGRLHPDPPHASPGTPAGHRNQRDTHRTDQPRQREREETEAVVAACGQRAASQGPATAPVRPMPVTQPAAFRQR
ncbi:hypothetical protein [Streptomyces sp. WAC 06783]|uniref:hypothetical protein n=1 Tax=Streptomyces sp. WAC 06783 TaxID=2203211 RepID=UPI00163C27DA|nr:hypothetical protein [Streptomyces sp. WAC 06783]